MLSWYSIVMFEKGGRKPVECWTRQAHSKVEAMKILACEGINVYNNPKYYFEVEDGKGTI